MNKVTPVVLVLIIINAALFFLNSLTTFEFNHWFALHYPDNPQYGHWQFVTSMFMHGGVVHLLVNMFGLYMFGAALERIWGSQKFLFFYFAAGIGAGIIYSLVNYFQFTAAYDSFIAFGLADFQIKEMLQTRMYDTRLDVQMVDVYLNTYHTKMLGASGAVYGILVAFAIRYPNTKLFLLFIPVPIAAKFFVPALLLLDLYLGITGKSLFGEGIAHFAHLGGALVGAFLMLYWRKGR